MTRGVGSSLGSAQRWCKKNRNKLGQLATVPPPKKTSPDDSEYMHHMLLSIYKCLNEKKGENNHCHVSEMGTPASAWLHTHTVHSKQCMYAGAGHVHVVFQSFKHLPSVIKSLVGIDSLKRNAVFNKISKLKRNGVSQT